jgi:hypothetical protein
MYDVSLINLTADARSAADSLVNIERSGLTGEELKILLQSFSEVDAVENAVAAPEIRVKVRGESYLIRTGQKKLMLYDVLHRELPALVLTLEEALAELDGSASATRNASAPRPPGAEFGESPAPPLPVHPVETAHRPRVITMAAVVFILFGAMIYLQRENGAVAAPASFHPVPPDESAALQSSLTGVYMTGNQPGHHGIVFINAREIKLFELSGATAPRVVYASGELGRVGSQLALATDQPGGLIEVSDHDTLVYCGEAYRRIP